MANIHDKIKGRRPLKVRGASFAHNFARWLSEKSITPNQISLMSIFFAGLSAACLFSLPSNSGILDHLLTICAAIFIQGRLLCNLFDGMVAVEEGKGTASGELFNDIPDRIADPLIIVAAGYSISIVPWGETLGWFAAILSVMTAYIRTLAVSIGAPVNFTGPMAKQHRMAILTVACLVSITEECFLQQSYALLIALVTIAIGCIITVFRRVVSAYTFLEKRLK